MMRNFVRAAVVMAAVVAPAITSAQARQGTPLDVQFSGLLYPQYVYGGQKGNATRSQNRFELDRAYLTADARLAERFTMKLTAEATQPIGGAGWVLRARHGYGEYAFWTNNKGWMGANAQARFGIQPTVLIEHEEQFWPRWVAKVATERAGFFSAADVGVSTTAKVNGVEIFASAMNGSGYMVAENDRFKDYSLRVTLEPVDGMTLSPWYYKGLRKSTRTDAAHANEGRKRDRMGVLAAYRAKAWMVGGDYAVATNENETPTAQPFATTDQSSKVISAYARLKPLAMMDPKGNAAWGLLVRWDQIDSDNQFALTGGDFPVLKGKFVVAGITYDMNNRVSWSFDWQQQSPVGAPAAGLDLRTYNVHASIGF
ncbi:MAG TPA: hypothetical protein VHM67_16060 [Gemmatimonadaceae bacterium]|nr:hypothetical protein [Gemmatimonadaceae bacterium]